MNYVKCIKNVLSSYGSRYFTKGKNYKSNGYAREFIDEEGALHLIGEEGEEWFDEHFRTLTDEEWIEATANDYAEIPDHDTLETEALKEYIDNHTKELKKQNETYSQMLEMIGQHMDEYGNSGLVNEYITLINIQSVFDNFRKK